MKQYGGQESSSLIINDNMRYLNDIDICKQEGYSLLQDNTEALNYLYLYSRGGHSSNNKNMRQKGSSCGCSKKDRPPIIKGGSSDMQGGCLDCPSGKKKVLSYLNIISKNISNIKKEFDKSTNKSKNYKGGTIADSFFDLTYLDLSTKHKFEYAFVEGNKSSVPR